MAYPNKDDMGKADWIYDAEFDLHIPCCSRLKEIPNAPVRKCGNGPLETKAIATGDCGEHEGQ